MYSIKYYKELKKIKTNFLSAVSRTLAANRHERITRQRIHRQLVAVAVSVPALLSITMLTVNFCTMFSSQH